ncbi:hypothetical protein [Rubrimonas cliftonensis]|uniref:Uncharacterized protein n=1 Tax=Rubrimonas cliftonensis TaxID=89524 RepID=A0A1H4ES53_9RHOB|nr:hypothetical protein [Rubrimonas cliftonensis]SEA87893.1 hypothetical protein SAMN05444370_11576 [Rubrimonas cliftonensis]
MTPPHIAAALSDLEREIDADTRGAPYELYIARANAASLQHAQRFEGDQRDTFLAAARNRGFYDPDVQAGWLLEATDDLCMHGLDYNCCPCGCGDVEFD